MTLRPWLFVLPVVALAGCQTLHEEMPGGTSNLGPNDIPVIVTSPSPGTSKPTPAPSATPTPAPTPTPTPAPTPTPTPAPDQGSSAIARVRVGFFGISCKNGKAEPRNGEGLLPTGCVGFVTATPKDKNGADVPAKVHGPDITWELVSGDAQVEVRPSVFESDFNRDVVGRRPGGFSLCATVKGVTGCLDAMVTP